MTTPNDDFTQDALDADVRASLLRRRNRRLAIATGGDIAPEGSLLERMQRIALRRRTDQQRNGTRRPQR